MKRNLAIDYLRSGVTILVVVHHAALAYTTFSHYDPGRYLRSTAPVVDVLRWMPLDLVVGFNDMFFMPLMFLISGLFVTPSLERKGCGRFLLDRTKRLGIPFIVSFMILSPLAFYPSWLLSDAVSRGTSCLISSTAATGRRGRLGSSGSCWLSPALSPAPTD